MSKFYIATIYVLFWFIVCHPVYMGKLFERGYQMGRAGYPWEKGPPGLILDP